MSVLSSRPVRGLRQSIAWCGGGAALWVLAVAGGSAGATAGVDQAAAKKTTKSRVYTSAQATRGESTYMSLCVSCHPPATYKGAVFLSWQGRSLGELLAFLQDKMPKNDPGSLTAKEYSDVIAYLLKLNAMPAGRVDLPADAKVLRTITIDILP
jgi:cytochrome c553